MAPDPEQRLEFLEAELSAYRAENDRLAKELSLTRAALGSLTRPAQGRGGLPAAGFERLPRAAVSGDDIVFHIDRCETGDRLVIIEGWAFCPRIDPGAATVHLILEGANRAWVARPKPEKRPDVAAALVRADLGTALPVGAPGRARLAGTGFSALWERPTPDGGGVYSLSIQIDGPDFSVRRTANLTVHG
jgi:hypothetical protein